MNAAVSHICISTEPARCTRGNRRHTHTDIHAHAINPPLGVHAPHASHMHRGMPNLCACARARPTTTPTDFCILHIPRCSVVVVVVVVGPHRRRRRRRRNIYSPYALAQHVLAMCAFVCVRVYKRVQYCADPFILNIHWERNSAHRLFHMRVQR